MSPVEPGFQGLHSHNDYLQTNPLDDALGLGFESIEVDLFLQAGELRVAHDAGSTTPGVTLDSMYLSPIAALSVGDHPAVLAIDLKDSGATLNSAFDAVVVALAAHATFADGHMTVLMAGNRPSAPGAYPSYVKFSGDRGLAAYADAEVLAIGIPWTGVFTWNGVGPMPEGQREALRIMVRDAHAHGKIVHVVEAPETVACWQEQYEAGVDWIRPGGAHPPGADDIAGLAAWFGAL